jgi:hypothetical protein
MIPHEPLRAALTTSREVHSEVPPHQQQLRLQAAMMPAVQKQKGVTMLNKLLGAAAIAALAFAVSPADAARVKAGCSGDNLGKTETVVENMADGEGKIAAQKEIAAAQDALLSGKAGVCAAHLSKAMQAGTVK